MLIEMVAATLSVFSGLTPIFGVAHASVQIIAPIPPQALETDNHVPEETLVAMLEEPTPTPTNTPTPTPTATPTPTPIPTATPTPTPPPVVTAPVDLDELFSRYSGQFSVDKDQLKRIAQCEAGFNNNSVNGDYVGMFQFATSSWSVIRGRMNADPNPDLRRNPDEAIKTAAFHIAEGGIGAWPSCK
jgi:hypothetical protein